MHLTDEAAHARLSAWVAVRPTDFSTWESSPKVAAQANWPVKSWPFPEMYTKSL